MCDVQTSLYEAKLPEFCHPKLTRVCKIATYNFRTLALKEQWPHILLGISWPVCNKPLVLRFIGETRADWKFSVYDDCENNY